MRRFLMSLSVVGALAAAQPAAACAWSMGWESWRPYQFQTADGPGGLDIDLVSAIADKAGCTVSFMEMPWARHLDRLAVGEIDLAAGASRTPEREGFAHFSAPYRTESVVLLTRADAAYGSLEEMLKAGGRLGVVREYEYGDAVSELIDGTYAAQVSAVDSDETNYKKLLGGRIDGLLLDPFTVGALQSELGGGTKIAASISDSPIHVMFAKTSTTPEDVKAFDDALAALRADGAYDRIIARYTGAQAGS